MYALAMLVLSVFAIPSHAGGEAVDSQASYFRDAEAAFKDSDPATMDEVATLKALGGRCAIGYGYIATSGSGEVRPNNYIVSAGGIRVRDRMADPLRKGAFGIELHRDVDIDRFGEDDFLKQLSSRHDAPQYAKTLELLNPLVTISNTRTFDGEVGMYEWNADSSRYGMVLNYFLLKKLKGSNDWVAKKYSRKGTEFSAEFCIFWKRAFKDPSESKVPGIPTNSSEEDPEKPIKPLS